VVVARYAYQRWKRVGEGCGSALLRLQSSQVLSESMIDCVILTPARHFCCLFVKRS
jgi:hypothetical protein